MTPRELKALFEAHDDEHIKFERVEHKVNADRHINGILLLQQIAPLKAGDQGRNNALASSSHDEVTLGFDVDEVAAHITEAQVIDLVRCGVRLNLHDHCFEMFV